MASVRPRIRLCYVVGCAMVTRKGGDTEGVRDAGELRLDRGGLSQRCETVEAITLRIGI